MTVKPFSAWCARHARAAALLLSLSLYACSRNGEPFFTPPPPPSTGPVAPSPLREMLVPDPSALADAGLAGTGSQANRGPEEPQPDRVHVAHVLVMHTQSVMRQPSVTRSPDEARAFANQLLARARAGEDVIALARQFSDEPGHENKGGDLGFITRGQTVAPFETAAFALPVGGISDVVQTDFGFHIIKRIE